MEALLAKVVNIRNAGCHALAHRTSLLLEKTLTAAYENLVGSILVTQLWCIAFPWFLCYLECGLGTQRFQYIRI